MKNVYTVLAIIVVLMLPGITKAQNIFPTAGRTGIGTATPQASAILDLDTTGLGFLAPRMTKTQRDAIATPATGLMIYQTNNTPGFYYYDGGAWKQMTPAGVNKSLSNLTTPTAVNTDLLPGSDVLMNLGSSSLFWRSVYLNNIHFKDGTIQTTAVNLYAAGTGIALTGNTFSNTGDTNGLDDANLSLTNLSATSINQSLIPNADNVKDLGTGLLGWRDLYVKGSIYFSGTRTISFFGTDNTFVGINAGISNNSGMRNSFFGKSAGLFNTIGGYNAFFGREAGYYNTAGSYNSFFGEHAGYSNSTGSQNSFFGKSAGYKNTEGYNNTFLGQGAGYNNTYGQGNVFIGANTGLNNFTGELNTCVGTESEVAWTDYYNTTAIGSYAYTTASNQIRIGDDNVTSIGGYAGWTNISDGRYKKEIKENVPGLAFINKLKPVTYHLDITGIRKFLKQEIREQKLSAGLKNKIETAVKAKEQMLNTGFIAQDVEKAAQELSFDFSGVDKPQNENSLYGLRYAEFVVPLVKAVQELSGKNDEKDAQIEGLQKQIDELKAMIVSGKDQTSTMSNQQKINLSQTAKLSQNQPNPFNQNTVVKYFVPEESTSSVIKITSFNGQEIKSITLSKGNGQITLQTGNLAAGTYQYSLIVDGKIIDSKKMILAR